MRERHLLVATWHENAAVLLGRMVPAKNGGFARYTGSDLSHDLRKSYLKIDPGEAYSSAPTSTASSSRPSPTPTDYAWTIPSALHVLGTPISLPALPTDSLLSHDDRTALHELRDLDEFARVLLNLRTEQPDGSFTDSQHTYVGQYDLPTHVRLPDPAPQCFTADSAAPTPKTFYDAMKAPHADRWLAAWNKEVGALSDSWYWTDAPRNKAICRTIGVFTIQLNADGTIKKYKVRICLDGSSMSRTEMGETF
jgi:hypothetical protein